MITVNNLSELRSVIAAARQAGKRIGFVPTMGNLHNGHMRLVDTARQHCDFVVASIFVNPMQFNDPKDLERYPRTLEADQALLSAHQCDVLFYPQVEEMYPLGMALQSKVSVPDVSEGLCGGARPGHFDGVATVVTKLFNMVQPDQAFFGEKDYQQLAVIRKMVSDLCMNITITGVPTCREESGLAMSSRNGYLSPAEKQQAAFIYQMLCALAQQLQKGARNFPELCQQACDALAAQGFRPDYVEIRNAANLKPASVHDTELVILTAAFLGNARLIDNLVVALNS
ncbi:MAG: pantoate--beta-alanine ligase [Oceanospirillaceae bacterium]|nr:pantoate--beta-alanine ligase [Oceanospirillaceae bacterium]MCP5335118.1 pantoate--beta-alanine ligase [Oceanospirillaceae bacterium]